eukprot:gnl/MRDRNA2_/MRDRNA2_75949_c0_seq1.p1 gnl/MRDRNA2_/MRDRNA2_75949_c0~~gnl/MRDRNA2_/MRDRNA2_75949_c0_seq1.p1  ORF type:complete len:381 (-),score=61.79 gnl/MRDRNA2_/MRDRNA2_75949_c0_seq1:91-1233(-)
MGAVQKNRACCGSCAPESCSHWHQTCHIDDPCLDNVEGAASDFWKCGRGNATVDQRYQVVNSSFDVEEQGDHYKTQPSSPYQYDYKLKITEDSMTPRQRSQTSALSPVVPQQLNEASASSPVVDKSGSTSSLNPMNDETGWWWGADYDLALQKPRIHRHGETVVFLPQSSGATKQLSRSPSATLAPLSESNRSPTRISEAVSQNLVGTEGEVAWENRIRSRRGANDHQTMKQFHETRMAFLQKDIAALQGRTQQVLQNLKQLEADSPPSLFPEEEDKGPTEFQRWREEHGMDRIRHEHRENQDHEQFSVFKLPVRSPPKRASITDPRPEIAVPNYGMRAGAPEVWKNHLPGAPRKGDLIHLHQGHLDFKPKPKQVHLDKC